MTIILMSVLPNPIPEGGVIMTRVYLAPFMVSYKILFFV